MIQSAETLNAFGRWLIPQLGRLSLELAILAGVVLVTVRLLRVRSPRMRHVFWGVVLAKPVVTFLVASPISLYWFLRPQAPPPAPEPAPVVVSAPARPSRSFPVGQARERSPRMVPPAVTALAGRWTYFDAHGVMAAVWLVGAGALGLRLVFGFAFVSFLRRTAVPQRDGPLAEAARDAARALGVRRRVQVAVSPVAHGPVLVGVIRPTILLPGGVTDRLTYEQVRLIIAHEVAHARRLDNPLLLVQRLAEMFLFFHPVVWLCGWAMRREAEAACDDAVIAAHGDALAGGVSAVYADSLTRVAEMRLSLTRRLLLNTFAAAESHFARRVRRLLRGPVGRMTVRVSVASTVALVVIALLGLPTAAERPARPAATASEDTTAKETEVSTRQGHVKGEDGKVWIEGMEKVNWGGSFFAREDSQARCLVEALRCAGHDVTYAEVMGLSGAAFKLTMAPNLHVAVIHSEMGMDWTEIVSRVWGVEYEWQAINLSNEENPGWRQQLHQAAVDSVGRGMPLFYMNGEWNLIVGYREDGSAFICRPYAGHEGDGYVEMGEPRGFLGDAWFASVLRPAGQAAHRRESVVRSLQAGVELARRPPEEDGGRLFGFQAYEAWITALEEDREDASKHGNAFSFTQLLTSRRAAAEYLRTVAEELGGDAAASLQRAADHYEAVAQHLDADDARELVAWPWEGKWTPENRAKEADILRECMAEEQVAVAEIEAALRALGEAVPEPSEAPAQPVTGDAPPTMLEGLTFPRWSITELGCMKACVDYLGRDVPKAWLYGGTAHAFFINIHGDVDVEAVTAWDHGFVRELTPNLGFLTDGFTAKKSEMEESDFRSRQREAWDFARRSIMLKQPCYGWELKAPYGDYWLITGFDDVGYYYDGWETGGPTPWQKLGDQFIPVLNVRNVKLCEPAADEVVVREALAAALEHARPNWDPTADTDAHFGPAAFDAWAHALESGAALHNHHAYNAVAWHECREMAVEFLREAKRRLPGRCDAAFDEALGQYAVVRDKLAELKELTPIDPTLGWGEAPKLQSDEAAALVRRAGVAERKGLTALAQILVALGGKPPEVVSVGADPPEPHHAAGVGGPRMLEGLEYPRRTAAELACVEGCLRYLGRDVSAAWLYGATGHAFAINMRPTVCVSSPYAWQKTLYELAANMGCRITGIKVARDEAGDEFPARQREAYDMVRDAIDRGLPCYADRVCWVPDYALITGYDDVGYYFSHPAATGGPTPWQKLGTEDIEVLDVWRVETCEAKPDDEVVRAALETVLQRAASPEGWTAFEGQRSGPAAFDLWADELESGHALLDSHTYNAHFWYEYRLMAAAFLEEAKERLSGRADAAFDEAIAHYAVVRDRLEAVRDMFPFRDGADWSETLQSPEAALLIREAGTAERQGLAALAKVLVALGGKPPQVISGGADPQDSPGRPKVTPRRFVLEGVPKVAYHTDRWRFTPFCNALDACLQYLGEPEQYDYLMCTSGAMFRMTWTPRAWDGGNSDILGMTEETLEPMRRAFWSAGYQMVPVAKADPDGWPEDILRDSAQHLGGELTDEAGFRRRITESINKGLPVIAFGVFGPPEACVITGYDEKGDVLIGWNVFQSDEGVETEPSGYFRVRNWYAKTRGLLLFGKKVGKPDPSELDRETLKWALKVLRTRRVRNSQAGPAAFEAWAADMLNDEYFPEGDIGVLRARLMCHWDSMTVTATRGGGSATAYLLAAAEREPAMAKHLRAAADCLEREDVVHGVAPGEEDQMAKLADPAVRRQVSDSILAARDMHAKAADHIEKALLAAGLPAEDIPQPEAVRDEPAGERSGRMVLEGVPKVGFGVIDGHVGMTPFPACLRASLEYMGDDLGFGSGGKYPRGAVYAYLMGTTGAAFRLLWRPGWHGDNVATFAIYDDPSEIFRRGFAAAGYEQIPSGHLPDAEKRNRFRSMVIESVRDRGLPVIAHGVIGPPEEAIIAGYDEDGAVAIGWSFFQDREIGHAGVEFEPNGYFRKRGWEADTWSMMAIGDRMGMPERRGAYIGALQNALRIMRDPVRGDCHSGIAAYDAWAEHILRDDEVAAGGGPDDPFIVHCDAADVVAEGRHYASVFLRQAAEVLPEAKDELLAAAECCKAEHDLIWKIWNEVGSNVPSEETRREFLKPDVRRRIEPIIREARDRDAEAAGHIERALLAVGAEPPEPREAPVKPGEAEGRREILLTGAVEDFKHIADNVAGHRIELVARGGDEQVYPQPYCYLTTRLIQMHAAGLGDMDFETLAVVSGASAMFGYQPGEFMPKYAFHHRGPDELVAQATGHATESVRVGDAHEAWDFVKESVDSGRPVSAWHGELMLLAGYRDADAEVDRQVFAMKDGDGYFAEWWAWDKFAEWVGDGQQLSRHSGRIDPRPKREVALRVMRDLVALSAGVPEHIRQAFPKATFGLAGIEAWADDCADVDEHTGWSMCHPENPQWTVRNSSAVYLQRIADEGVLCADATEHVRRGAELYRAAYRSWQEAYGLVGYAAPDGSGKVREKRLAAATAVRRAAEHERAAISDLRQALAAEGVAVPVTSAEEGPPIRADGTEPDASGTTSAGRVKRADGKVWLEGLRSRPAWITHMGCLKGCMEYLGNDASRAWAYGGTGFAFALNIHEAICPSGPTAWPEQMCDALAANIGAVVELISAHKSDAAFAETQQKAWRTLQEAIDAGWPCFGWELDVPEWYVIHGYDGEGNVLFRDFGGEERKIHHTKLGDTGIGVAAIMVVKPGPVAGDRTTVRDALAFAVEHGAGEHSAGLYRTGLLGYDAWIAALEDDELANTDDAIGFGQGYNGKCWAEGRHRAVEFLQEAKKRLNDDALSPLFDEAVTQYRTVSQSLDQVSTTFPFDVNQQPAMAERIKEPERRRQAVAALRAAREAEASGLKALAAIAAALGAEGVDAIVLPTPGTSAGRPASVPAEALERREGAVKTLEGLEWQKHAISQLACIEGCLKYLGSDISSAWLFGGTGHAFVINIEKVLNPSGPTAWNWEALHDLGPNLGYRTERVYCWKHEAGDTYPEKQKEAWDFVRAATDRGVPCYGWELHPWIPDYYVITGYDDTGYYYSGCVTGGPLEWQKLGDTDVTVIQVFSVERCEPGPAEKVVKDMLDHVLPRVEKPDGWTGSPTYVSGQPAFEAWARQVEEGQVIKDGHSYNAWCWQECRAMAVEFLKEAKDRLPGRCDEAFDEAIAHYTVVRDNLQAVVDLHPLRMEGWDNETKLTSAEAAALLREAGAAEHKGIQALKKIAAAL